MTSWIRPCAVWLTALLAAVVVHAQPAAPVVPLAAFFKKPQMARAALSPSGRWLMSLSGNATGRVGFLLIDLDGKEKPQAIEASEKDDVFWFRWINDDWLVFSVVDPEDRSEYGLGAGLMSMTRDGKQSRMLVARDWERLDGIRARRRALQPNHRFFGMGAPGTTEVILSESIADVRGEYSHTSLKVLDVTNASTRTLDTAAPQASGWLLDGQGRARMASSNAEGIVTRRWLDPKTGAWSDISKAPVFQQPFLPQYIDSDDGLIVGTAGRDGGLQLRRFDFTTKKPSAQTLLTTPGFNGPVSVVRNAARDAVVGLHVDLEVDTAVWFSPLMRALQAKVDARFPGHVNTISCAPCEGNARVLIHSYSDADPGVYVLYEPEREQWRLVGQERPDVDPSRMAQLDLHRIKARDGSDLPVWVTRAPAPAGSKLAPAPAVVLVHGGPHLRGTSWHWNPEAQFLASRGYVVIQPEFRGSKGYGNEHERAGFKQWGLAMQDDISDALHWAVAQGMVDASKVCIMGGSYGGYAALMGVARDPDQYSCAVALAAVSDPRFMYDFHWNDLSISSREYALPQTLGDRKADEARFIATSPIEQVQRIKAPVLLVHGGVDRRVPVQNAERMRDALVRAGKAHEFVLYDDEGHGFFYEKNRLDYYRRVEAFLAKYLQPAR